MANSMLTVLEQLEERDSQRCILVKCRCECGNTTILRKSHLKDVKSCGCLLNKPEEDISMRGLMAVYRNNARRADRSFDLSESEFKELTSSDCTYCGVAPKQQWVQGSGKRFCKYTYNGIDRIDNDKGYILENCTPCCQVCNRAKNNMNINDFMNWVERIVNNNKEVRHR